MEKAVTNTTAKRHTMYFSDLRGRRESGVIRPIVMAQAETMNLARPAAAQETGGRKLNAVLHLAASSIAISTREMK